MLAAEQTPVGPECEPECVSEAAFGDAAVDSPALDLVAVEQHFRFLLGTCATSCCFGLCACLFLEFESGGAPAGGGVCELAVCDAGVDEGEAPAVLAGRVEPVDRRLGWQPKSEEALDSVAVLEFLFAPAVVVGSGGPASEIARAGAECCAYLVSRVRLRARPPASRLHPRVRSTSPTAIREESVRCAAGSLPGAEALDESLCGWRAFGPFLFVEVPRNALESAVVACWSCEQFGEEAEQSHPLLRLRLPRLELETERTFELDERRGWERVEHRGDRRRHAHAASSVGGSSGLAGAECSAASSAVAVSSRLRSAAQTAFFQVP